MARRAPSSDRGSAGCGPHVPRRPFGRAGSAEPDGRRPARACLVLWPWISRSRDGQRTHLRSAADGGGASDAAAGHGRARDEPQERPHGHASGDRSRAVRPERPQGRRSSTCRRALRGGSDSFETGWSSCAWKSCLLRTWQRRRLATDGYNERRCQTDRLRSTPRSMPSASPTSATTTHLSSPVRMPRSTGPTSRPVG